MLKRLFTTTTPKPKPTQTTTTTTTTTTNPILASYYRGGTSRALLFNATHLPPNRADWAPIFRGAMGSPDPVYGRQLDGMGGGISSLSKICVVKKREGKELREEGGDDDADVDFTFVQVGIRDGGLDYEGNCGNMTAAIGPFVVDSGVIKPKPKPKPQSQSKKDKDTVTDDENTQTTTIKIHNTNTNKSIHATFPVTFTNTNTNTATAASTGPFAIDGVPGTHAKIRLDFIDPAGSKTNSLLPTGTVIDEIDGIRTTCVDVGNPCVFIRAREVEGILIRDNNKDKGKGQGKERMIQPDELSTKPEILAKLESIRKQATLRMGMVGSGSLSEVPPSIPKVCLVSESESGSGSSAVDVNARAISTGQPHKALPITTGLALSAAAKMPGSVVNECLRGGGEGKDEVVIGHPSGSLVVGARYGEDGKLERVTVYRTARRLMEGTVYWK